MDSTRTRNFSLIRVDVTGDGATKMDLGVVTWGPSVLALANSLIAQFTSTAEYFISRTRPNGVELELLFPRGFAYVVAREIESNP